MKYHCIYCKKEYESPREDRLEICNATVFDGYISFQLRQKCYGEITDRGNGNKLMCGGFDYSMPIKIPKAKKIPKIPLDTTPPI